MSSRLSVDWSVKHDGNTQVHEARTTLCIVMPLLIDVLCCAVIHCLHKQVVAGVCDAADATTTAFSRMALTLAEIARVRVFICNTVYKTDAIFN
jgi:hypothetical protein